MYYDSAMILVRRFHQIKKKIVSLWQKNIILFWFPFLNLGFKGVSMRQELAYKRIWFLVLGNPWWNHRNFPFSCLIAVCIELDLELILCAKLWERVMGGWMSLCRPILGSYNIKFLNSLSCCTWNCFWFSTCWMIYYIFEAVFLLIRIKHGVILDINEARIQPLFKFNQKYATLGGKEGFFLKHKLLLGEYENISRW